MAELKTAAIFSDHMVLQRDKQIKIFGEGSEGRRVRVQLSGPDGIRKADAPVYNGRFVAVLMPLPAGGPYEMVVTDGQKQIAFSDIMIGKVWLAGFIIAIRIQVRKLKCSSGNSGEKIVIRKCTVV